MHDHEQAQRRSAPPQKPKEPAAPSVAAPLGNAAVARIAKGGAVDRSGGGPAALDQTIARAIEQKRGGGRELDGDARTKLEGAMGEDFSDVRIHSDSEAHELSEAVSAEAFTTGSDVFFQSGKYEPGSSEGQKLLAHELTHVVQQRGAPAASELTVSEPGDPSEVEAGSVADRVSSAAPAGPSAAGGVSRSAEEEELQLSRIDRASEEEELLQGSFVDRAAPEEELQMSPLDRAGPEEEEPLQG